MKKLGKLISSILLLSPFGAIFSTGITSCSSNVDFFIENDTFVNEGNNFIIPFKSSKPIDDSKVNIQIVGDDRLEVVKPDILLDNNKANVVINVKPSVLTDEVFNVSIKFTYNKNGDSNRTFESKKLKLYYSYVPPLEQDVIVVETKIYENVNKYHFDIPIQFSGLPLSDIDLVMRTDNDAFKLTANTIKVEDRKGYYYATIGIDLDIIVHETTINTFDLVLSFVNSFNKHQTTTIDKLTTTFFLEQQDDFPVEYLDIQNGVLCGFENISQDVINEYTELKIPNSVTEIKENAFGETENNIAYSNIHKIVVPSSVTVLGDRAFAGCHNLFEVDLSSYDDVPIWMSGKTRPVFFDKCFHELGSIWLKNSQIVEKIRDEGYDVGVFPQEWKNCYIGLDEIIPDKFYKFESDGTRLALIGIKHMYYDELPKYRVCKIPSDVQVIKKNALSILGIHPYEWINHKIATRRIVFNKKLEEIEPAAFKWSSIAGPVYFNCSKLTSLPDNCFTECIDWYKQEGGAKMPVYYFDHLNISFEGTAPIEEIGENCFWNCIGGCRPVNSSYNDDTITTKLILTKQIKTIKSHGFGQLDPGINVVDLTLLENTLPTDDGYSWASDAFGRDTSWSDFSGKVICSNNKLSWWQSHFTDYGFATGDKGWQCVGEE